MKLNILLIFLFFFVIFYNVVIFGRILYGSDKGILRSYLGLIGKKYGYLKIGDKIILKRILRKLFVVGSLLR